MQKNRTGQAIVEMALVNYQWMQAARVASKRINPLPARNVISPTTHPKESEVQKAFWKNKSPLMPENSYSNLSYSGVGNNSPAVEIKASFSLSLFTPIIGKLVGGDNKQHALTIHASSMEHGEQRIVTEVED
jgi:hypothetical protein